MPTVQLLLILIIYASLGMAVAAWRKRGPSDLLKRVLKHAQDDPDAPPGVDTLPAPVIVMMIAILFVFALAIWPYFFGREIHRRLRLHKS
ncbi:hypothetical protein [Streptomyces violascens]|uniref:hypothetical protein n=1 Tax=Streptomyces violascens TaxID=67381 RepID=UPI0016757533|nr:hypothetical protein [Streptomyces violascens]